jgi:hypothetical protein
MKKMFEIEPYVGKLNAPSDGQLLYKIMIIESLLLFIFGSYLHFNHIHSYKEFPEADEFDGKELPKDNPGNISTKFENALNYSDYYDALRKLTYACCFSLENSDFIWKTYANNSKSGKVFLALSLIILSCVQHFSPIGKTVQQAQSNPLLSSIRPISSNTVNQPFMTEKALAEGWKAPFPANSSLREITTARETTFYQVNVPANTILTVGRIGAQLNFGLMENSGFQYHLTTKIPISSFTNTRLILQPSFTNTPQFAQPMLKP